MKILVTGASGLVGSRFVELHSRLSELLMPSQEELDITSLESVKNYFKKYPCDAVVNFAAYTNVGEAENQRGDKNGDCWKVNVNGVANLLSALTDSQLLIQISTDMVFPGSAQRPGPYSESDLAEIDSSKVTWYGFTKAEAERLVGNRGTILRLIYPVRAHFDRKLDYLRKHIKLFNEGKLYPLFTDQQVSITFIDEACLAVQKIIDQKAKGVFHAGSSDTVIFYDLICYLLKQLREDVSGIEKTSIDTLNNPVRYPKYGGLQVEETEKKLGIKFSTWKEIVDDLVEQGITA